MKHIILILCVVLPILSYGQDKSVKKFYNKYKYDETVTSVKIQGWMLKMAAKFAEDEEDDGEAAELLRKVTRLRVIAMEDGNVISKKDLNQFKKEMAADNFEPLMQVREDGQIIDFFIREADEVITDLVVLVKDKEEFIMLNLEGNLKFEDLRKLDFDVEGGDSFKKLPTKKDDIPRA